MIVVSDSTPLITLMKGGKLHILRELFGTVLIPKAVFAELTRNEEYQSEIDLIRDSNYIQVVTVGNSEHVTILQRATGLDLGESEAIVYADESKADVLLMDEKKGRAVATNMKLRISGSIGVLITAYKKHLLSPTDYTNTIKVIAGSKRHISDDVIQFALSIVEDTEQMESISMNDNSSEEDSHEEQTLS